MSKIDAQQWQEERAARMAELSQQLEDGVVAFQDSAAFKAYLKMQSRFHSYSWGNALLIMRQLPDATHVAGFQAWKKHGRWVKKGEHGASILAPMLFRVEDENGSEDDRVVTRFKTTTVFDISQTEGADLPELVPPTLDGDCEASIYVALAAFADSINIRLKNSDPGAMPSGAKGYYRASADEIYVAPAGAVQMTRVLAHELGHALDQELRQSSREVRETVAESVAFIVTSYFGLPCGDYSFFYIGSWLQNSDGRGALRLTLDRSQKIAARLIDAIADQAEPADELAAA